METNFLVILSILILSIGFYKRRSKTRSIEQDIEDELDNLEKREG